jgi:hypothetical protein
MPRPPATPNAAAATMTDVINTTRFILICYSSDGDGMVAPGGCIAAHALSKFQIPEPLAKRRRQAFPTGRDLALKTQIEVTNRINANQFAIFILQFSFFNPLPKFRPLTDF